MTDYRVQTDIYSGPMDLLLYLIKRDEIDIYDIPVSRITGQYVHYVETLKVIDPDVAAEFLVMAAVLMEIKSRMLLPRPPAEEGDDQEDLSDPRLELVRQLLEYKKFKDASFELTRAAEVQAQRWPRVPARIRPKDLVEVDLDDVQIWDLVGAFNKVLASVGAGQVTHDVIFDDTPIPLHAADIVDRLQREDGRLAFEAIFVGRRKVEMIGLFLALLELMRQQRVTASQESVDQPIFVVLLSAEPIAVGDEWGPAFAESVLGLDAAGSPLDSASTDLNVTQQDVENIKHDRDGGPDDEAGAASPAVELDPDELEGFSELDDIKVDVDIDAILRKSEAFEQETANADREESP